MADLAVREADDTVELAPVAVVEPRRHLARDPRGAGRARSRRAPGPLGPVGVMALWSGAVISALCLWLVVSTLALGAVQQRAEQGRLYDALRLQLANGTAPLGPATAGAPVALLSAPGAGIADVVVVEGTASKQTQRGPGHRRDTVLPGQPGVSVLLGRGALYGAAFGGIPQLRAGDLITATTGQGEFVYRVDGVRRAGDLLPAPLAPGGGRLTLGTVEGASWRNGFAAKNIVYVDATLRGQARLPSAPRPSAVGPAEQLMGGDRGAVLPLLLWMQALVLVAVALAWAQARWGVWQAWLVGAPVLLAVLWSASTVAAQLLPNLL